MGEVAERRGGIALDQPQVRELYRHAGVQVYLARRCPAHRALALGAHDSIDLGAAVHVQDDVESSGRRAPHLIQRDQAKVRDAVAGLLGELAPGPVLDPLVSLDGAARKKPCPGERSAGLLHDQDPAGRVDTCDDRPDIGALRRARYGVFLGVGRGSGSVGRGVGVCSLGGRVGVGVGLGVGDGVGQGSGVTRFQL
jgi:hypothetical protein